MHLFRRKTTLTDGSLMRRDGRLLGLGIGAGPPPPVAVSTDPAAPIVPTSVGVGVGVLGVSASAGLDVGGLLGGGGNSPEVPSSTNIAQTTTASVAPTTNAPVAISSSLPQPPSPGPATSSAAQVTIPTTAPPFPSTIVTSPAGPINTPLIPEKTSSSALGPQTSQSPSSAKELPSKASSLREVSSRPSTQQPPSSNAAQTFSTASLKITSASMKAVTNTPVDGTLQSTLLSITSPTAAEDVNGPTLATSMITSVTRTGSSVGVTTETTDAGIVVTQSVKPPSGMSVGTVAAVSIGAAAAGLLLASLIVFYIRKFRRARRIARAESPPSSPLLNASSSPFSPAAPLRIEVGMHQRMRSNESSDFWISGKGSNINEKVYDGYRYPMPISPLPRLPESREETEYDRGQMANGEGYPVMDRGADGKPVMPRNF